MCDWSIFTLFLLNRGWKPDSLQIMIFVYVCASWVIFELKTRFEKWITGNDVIGVRLFYPSYLITLMAYLCSQWTPNIQNIRLFVLKMGWKFDSLQMMIFVNVCSTWSMVQLKTRFKTWITLNDLNGVSLFHLSYLITLMVYLRSQQTPNVQNQVLYVWLVYIHTICA
jgi:hypothetical protein